MRNPPCGRATAGLRAVAGQGARPEWRSSRCSFYGGMGRGPRSAGMPVRRPGRGRRGNGHDLDDGRLPRTHTKASCSTGRRGLIPSRPSPAPRRVPWSPGPGWRGVGLTGRAGGSGGAVRGASTGGTSAPGEHPVRGAHRFLEGDPRRARARRAPAPSAAPDRSPIDPGRTVRTPPMGPRSAIRSARRCDELRPDLAPRGLRRPGLGFGRLGLGGRAPDHRGFSKNGHGPRSRSGDPRRPVLEGSPGRARPRTGRRRHRAPQSTARGARASRGPRTPARRTPARSDAGPGRETVETLLGPLGPPRRRILGLGRPGLRGPWRRDGRAHPRRHGPEPPGASSILGLGRPGRSRDGRATRPTPRPPTPSPPATAAKTPAGPKTPARSERPTRRATRDAPGPGPDRGPPPPETEPRARSRRTSSRRWGLFDRCCARTEWLCREKSDAAVP